MPVTTYVALDEPAEGFVLVPIGGGPVLPIISTDPDPDPGAETPGPATAQIIASVSPDRVNATPLDGSTRSAPLAVFTTETGVGNVRFSIDGVFERQENTAPFDLKGGVGSDSVLWTPTEGSHTVTAVITWTDASRDPVTLTATFDYEPATPPTSPGLAAPVLAVPTVTETVSLSWSSVAGATSYRLFRNGGSIVQQAGTTYTDTAVVAGASYTYHVVAADAVGESPASNTRTAVPTAPSGGGGQPPAGVVKPIAGQTAGHGTGGMTSVLEPMGGGSFPGGTVIRNKRISGSVRFTGPGGKLINCEVNYSGTVFAVVTDTDDFDVYIERCTINAPNAVGILVRNRSTVRWCAIFAGKDGIKAWNYGLYESNYIRMARPAGSSVHCDGIQGSGKTNWTARGNNIDVNHDRGGNFSIFCQAYTGQSDKHIYDCVIEDNWVSCGNSATATGDGKAGSGFLHNIVIRRNLYEPRGRYFPRVHQQQGDTRFDRATNVWVDTGQPILNASGQPQR